MLVPGLPDPGINDDVMEAILDLDLAGASAPNATILYVYTQHVYYAAQYAIDQNLAPVLTYSYGNCEKAYISYPGDRDAYRSLAKQANAEGITWLAASGDTGPAGCENTAEGYVRLTGATTWIPASFPR